MATKPNRTKPVLDLPAPEECRAAVDAVLASRTFERSERLRRFLDYVCETVLRGEGAQINEYRIGADVFDRGPDYDPGQDSVVRRQAHSLRLKLLEYYAREGLEDPVRIELTPGTYAPVFHRQGKPQSSSPSALREPPPRSANQGRRRTAAIVAVCGLALAAAWGGWSLKGRQERGAAPGMHPAAREVWAPWFQENAGVAISLSNPHAMAVRHVARELLPEAPPWWLRADSAMEDRSRKSFGLNAGGYVYLIPKRTYTVLGEAVAAVRLAGFLSVGGLTVRAAESGSFSSDDVSQSNTVVLGAGDSNPWVAALLEKYPWRLEGDTGDRRGRIVNLKPRTGEAVQFATSWAAMSGQSAKDQHYALISMLPGIDPRRNLLVIGGISSQAIAVAAEFLTNPATLEILAGRLRTEAPGHRGPWRFQAVLRSELHKSVRMGTSIATLRVLDR